MIKSIYIQLIVRSLLLASNGIAIYYLFDHDYTVTLVVSCLFLIAQIVLFIDYIKLLLADVEKSIDCLLYDDYSISIPAKKRKNSLYNKTALLIEKHKKRVFEQTSEQVVFTNIIESLTLGILILRKDTKGQIEIFQINDTFVNFLQIPKYYKWELLKEKIEPIINLIDQNNWKKLRHTVSININDKTETFFLKTSVTKTNEFEYLIISLETIQQLIDKKEKEAWYKLMNVMSHEIINTITPISSLASNLDTLLQEDNQDEDTFDELSEGLQIIKKRSLHLTDFVSSYRKLAELPFPDKKEIDIINLIHDTLALFKEEFEQKNITIDFQNQDRILLSIDSKQIEQVFINLISNSLYAFEGIEHPKISIRINKTNLRTNITFTDNGIGISKEIKDTVFIPYFTTRKNGSGIGLTLSKNIMESHDGHIYFKSEKGQTIFILSFV